MALAILTGVVLGAAAAFYTGVPPQTLEKNQLTDLTNAKFTFIGSLANGRPDLIEPSQELSYSRLEHLALFLQEVEDPQIKEHATQFLTTLDTYRQNLSKFIDQEVPGATTHEKYLAAKSQYKTHGDDKSKARFHYFEHRLETERLSKGDTTEEGAYAKVLQAREQLRLAKLYFSPGAPGLKTIQSHISYSSSSRTSMEKATTWSNC